MARSVAARGSAAGKAQQAAAAATAAQPPSGGDKKAPQGAAPLPSARLLALGVFVAGAACVLAGYALGGSSSSGPQAAAASSTGVRQLELKHMRSFFHDKTAFVQGLFYMPGVDVLVEGTGMYGESDLRVLNATDGRVLGTPVKMEDHLFGEGITYDPVRKEVLQMTWRELVIKVFKYSEATAEARAAGEAPLTFELDRTLGRRDYPATTRRELWGICSNQTHLFVSDGSERIHIWTNTQPPKLVKKVAVRMEVPAEAGAKKRAKPKKRAVQQVNELECLPQTDGRGMEILANVWFKTDVLRIDADTGDVLQVFDLEEISKPQLPNVLNGLAYDAERSQLYVTGKNWDTMHVYELTL